MTDDKILTKEIAQQFLEDKYSVRLADYEKLDDDAAEILRRHTGRWLLLTGLTTLSDAAAESLSKRPGDLDLKGLTKITDAAAEHLSKHEGELYLKGLTLLSDAAAESLSKHEGPLVLNGLNGLTELSDAAAESLSKCQGALELNGLTELSDAAAESLSKCQGALELNGLTELSDAAAESLSRCGWLFLDGLTSLSDAAAESLSKHKGSLSLDGLAELSDAAAESLSKCEEDDLQLQLDSLPASAAEILRNGWSKPKILTQQIAEQFLEDEDSVDLEEFTSIEDEAAEGLSKCTDELYLDLSGLTSLSDAAAESLSKHKGSLGLDGLTELSDAAAESLSKNTMGLSLLSLSYLSDSAAESLSKHEGKVFLTQVVKLSESAATYIRTCISPVVEYCGVPIKQIEIHDSDESQIDLETKLTLQRVSAIQNLIDDVDIVAQNLSNSHHEEYGTQLSSALKKFAFRYEIVQSGGLITTAIAEAIKTNLNEESSSDQEVANHLFNFGFEIDDEAKTILAEWHGRCESGTDE